MAKRNRSWSPPVMRERAQVIQRLPLPRMVMHLCEGMTALPPSPPDSEYSSSESEIGDSPPRPPSPPPSPKRCNSLPAKLPSVTFIRIRPPNPLLLLAEAAVAVAAGTAELPAQGVIPLAASNMAERKDGWRALEEEEADAFDDMGAEPSP